MYFLKTHVRENKWKIAIEKEKLEQESQEKCHMLEKSRKILYENFVKKFNRITDSLGILDNSEGQIQYDQYLIVLKGIIFMDNTDESKISESEEVFEGWRAMNGDKNGFVGKENLKQFLISALDLKQQKSSGNKNNRITYENKLKNECSVMHSTIDLLKMDENEVRLDVIENPPANSSNKSLDIKPKNQKYTVSKNVKQFLTQKFKENKQKVSKEKSKDRKSLKNMNKSNFCNFIF